MRFTGMVHATDHATVPLPNGMCGVARGLELGGDRGHVHWNAVPRDRQREVVHVDVLREAARHQAAPRWRAELVCGRRSEVRGPASGRRVFGGVGLDYCQSESRRSSALGALLTLTGVESVQLEPSLHELVEIRRHHLLRWARGRALAVVVDVAPAATALRPAAETRR